MCCIKRGADLFSKWKTNGESEVIPNKPATLIKMMGYMHEDWNPIPIDLQIQLATFQEEAGCFLNIYIYIHIYFCIFYMSKNFTREHIPLIGCIKQNNIGLKNWSYWSHEYNHKHYFRRQVVMKYILWGIAKNGIEMMIQIVRYIPIISWLNKTWALILSFWMGGYRMFSWLQVDDVDRYVPHNSNMQNPT